MFARVSFTAMKVGRNAFVPAVGAWLDFQKQQFNEMNLLFLCRRQEKYERLTSLKFEPARKRVMILSWKIPHHPR